MMRTIFMRTISALLLAATLAPAMMAVSSTAASAQATCRQKCMDEENACLKRTGNKSQCGDRAKACASKCK
jgi:Spy/CpxP family protein refolding chaperone